MKNKMDDLHKKPCLTDDMANLHRIPNQKPMNQKVGKVATHKNLNDPSAPVDNMSAAPDALQPKSRNYSDVKASPGMPIQTSGKNPPTK